MVRCERGFDSLLELEHHPTIPNSTIIPDFAIKLKASNRYIFVIEVKKTARDVTSQRFVAFSFESDLYQMQYFYRHSNAETTRNLGIQHQYVVYLEVHTLLGTPV